MGKLMSCIAAIIIITIVAVIVTFTMTVVAACSAQVVQLVTTAMAIGAMVHFMDSLCGNRCLPDR
jgi:hypothetical protein